MSLRTWANEVADLVLGRACLLCDAPGPSLCTMCVQTLRGRPTTIDLDPLVMGDGLPLTYALPYRPVGGALVLAYKERGDRSLSQPLGCLLSDALLAAAAGCGPAQSLTVIPIPGHSRPQRGFDALGAILRSACREMRRHGVRADIAPALRLVQDHAPLKGLRRSQRWATVRHSMRADPAALDRLPPDPLIIVDDVVTTGATIVEAARALASLGVDPPRAVAITHRALVSH